MASGGQWTPRAAARELQLPPAADEALVKKRYRELAKQLHPDRNKGTRPPPPKPSSVCLVPTTG